MPIKKRQTAKIYSYDGQALIELLVAFVLLSIILTGLIIVGLYSVRNTQYARNRSTATKLASQQLERVRVLRDSSGLKVLPSCSNPCFLDVNLTMTPLTPTGQFGQSLMILVPSPSDCPLPPNITGTTYKATADVYWDQNPNVTPKKVEINSCFNDWQL